MQLVKSSALKWPQPPRVATGETPGAPQALSQYAHAEIPRNTHNSDELGVNCHGIPRRFKRTGWIMVEAMESGGNMEYDSKRVEYSNRMKFLAQSKWSLLSVFFEACNSGKHSKRNIPHLFWQCRAQEYGRMNSPDL